VVFGKFTDAVSDLSETLRRVFQNPRAHAVDTGLILPQARGVAPLVVEARLPAYELSASPRAVSPGIQAVLKDVDTAFEGRLQAEEGWTQWAAGAKVCEMPTFEAGSRRRVDVPPLPRRAACRQAEPERFRASSRTHREGFALPAVRGGSPELSGAVVRGGLDLLWGIPVAIQGQDVQTLPKAQWMRYSLQLVKSTGENIRNLEVLGLFRIPSRGVRGMRHDAKTGRLFLELSREASGAARKPFILAQRRDDRTLVSCFLEEG